MSSRYSGSNLHGKGEIWIYSCYGAVKLHEYGIKLVERVLEKRLHRIVTFDKMLFGFMPERGTIYAVFILRRIQEECHAKGKSCVCGLSTLNKFLT